MKSPYDLPDRLFCLPRPFRPFLRYPLPDIPRIGNSRALVAEWSLLPHKVNRSFSPYRSVGSRQIPTRDGPLPPICFSTRTTSDHSRVCKTDHRAKLKADILNGNAKHRRKTRDNQAGECERSGNHSAVQGTSSENKTVFRDCRREEPGTSQPRPE